MRCRRCTRFDDCHHVKQQRFTLVRQTTLEVLVLLPHLAQLRCAIGEHDAFVWTTLLAYDSIFPALGPGMAHVIVKWGLAALLIQTVLGKLTP